VTLINVDGSDGDDCAHIARSFSDRLAIRVHRRADLPSWTAKT
jgi:hypothetical protein